MLAILRREADRLGDGTDEPGGTDRRGAAERRTDPH